MTSHKWLEAASERSERVPMMLGSVFAQYREQQELSVEALARQLGCTVETLNWVSLCRKPKGAVFSEQVHQIAARFSVDAFALFELLRDMGEPEGVMVGETAPANSALGGDDNYLASFEESLPQTLSLEHRANGLELDVIMHTFREQIGDSLSTVNAGLGTERQLLLHLLRSRPQSTESVGLYRVTPEELMAIHGDQLIRGNVEAVCSRAVSYDMLPLGITQLGIATVRYGGSSGTFAQRLFRKDVTHERMEDLFQRGREPRQPHSHQASRCKGHLPRLAVRGIRTYAERAILVERLQAEWRMGRGNPLAHELLTGLGDRRLQDASLEMLRRLIDRHPKFVFVMDTMEHRALRMLGHALAPGEYVILETLDAYGKKLLDDWRFDNEGIEKARAFVERYCPQVVTGLYRTSKNSSPRQFYAHQDHAHFAVRVAMADSIPRSEQSFPLLLDVAAATCRSVFGEDGFEELVQDAYAEAPTALDVARRA